jgi:hypothetical protein
MSKLAKSEQSVVRRCWARVCRTEWSSTRAKRRIRELPAPVCVAVLAAAVLGWVHAARADIEFAKITTEVETMKSDFLTLLKTVLVVASIVIVVKGLAVVGKKFSNNEPQSTWHLVGVGAAAGVLLIAIAII